ncbi:carbohydrate ABC transporter permease [Paenibacillus sp. FSL H7-0331]|uniref:carbohydrate ABC transporter permease n=1 Tax=Paenibacillus sp. FSL H7-0331 TaxID=1920421 RepID=UPI00096BFDAC|nr:carbohydrate ABC transporter permease [Paenibacillus sp. FSL H7-0331]OMF10980.1 ABC transporter permease [Paenibacillus sp. FSL H7-0331]
MIHEKSIGSRMFDIINYLLLFGCAIATIVPFIHIVAGSLTTAEGLLQNSFVLIPTDFTLDAYRYIFTSDSIANSLLITIYITVLGTLFNLLFTVLTAYPLARNPIIGKQLILFLIVLTIVFRPGMIPNFIVVKSVGLLDSIWSLIIPSLISPFYLIITKNFFQQLPKELEESAKIDGYNDLQILFRIFLPLSKPMLATFSLFYAVANWNTFMPALLYINDATKWPIQIILRQIVLLAAGGAGAADAAGEFAVPPSVKMAVIVIATLPIMLVYMMLQKYFVSGLMVGSVKG